MNRFLTICPGECWTYARNVLKVKVGGRAQMFDVGKKN